MKGIICYYSSTGNTRLACEYLARRLHPVEIDLLDITQPHPVDWSEYAVAGFATFTHFQGPAQLFQDFMRSLPPQPGKPAFVFNTYGLFPGQTLKSLKKLAAAQAFEVLAGHSLAMPESYPPLVASGQGQAQAPAEKELRAFAHFASELRRALEIFDTRQEIHKQEIRLDVLNRLWPIPPRVKARATMGLKFVDETLCTECGACAQSCPYRAIRLNPKPVFDQNRCYGCWACYNHCPTKAIYTRQHRGAGHYAGPSAELREKLSAEEATSDAC